MSYFPSVRICMSLQVVAYTALAHRRAGKNESKQTGEWQVCRNARDISMSAIE